MSFKNHISKAIEEAIELSLGKMYTRYSNEYYKTLYDSMFEGKHRIYFDLKVNSEITGGEVYNKIQYNLIKLGELHKREVREKLIKSISTITNSVDDLNKLEKSKKDTLNKLSDEYSKIDKLICEYQISDYKNGKCKLRWFSSSGLQIKEDKNEYNIGKILQKYNKTDVLELFKNDPLRTGSLSIVISRHPYDIAGMSTNRGWRSCMHLKDGCNREYVKSEILSGTLVAYLISKKDKNINNPFSRIAIKPYFNDSGNRILQASKTYGIDPTGEFKEQLQKFLNEKFNINQKTGNYHFNPISYNDNETSSVFNFGKNGEQFIKRELKTKNLHNILLSQHYVNFLVEKDKEKNETYINLMYDNIIKYAKEKSTECYSYLEILSILGAGNSYHNSNNNDTFSNLINKLNKDETFKKYTLDCYMAHILFSRRLKFKQLPNYFKFLKEDENLNHAINYKSELTKIINNEHTEESVNEFFKLRKKLNEISKKDEQIKELLDNHDNNLSLDRFIKSRIFLNDIKKLKELFNMEELDMKVEDCLYIIPNNTSEKLLYIIDNNSEYANVLFQTRNGWTHKLIKSKMDLKDQFKNLNIFKKNISKYIIEDFIKTSIDNIKYYDNNFSTFPARGYGLPDVRLHPDDINKLKSYLIEIDNTDNSIKSLNKLKNVEFKILTTDQYLNELNIDLNSANYEDEGYTYYNKIISINGLDAFILFMFRTNSIKNQLYASIVYEYLKSKLNFKSNIIDKDIQIRLKDNGYDPTIEDATNTLVLVGKHDYSLLDNSNEYDENIQI